MRSLFFHYGLKFVNQHQSVIYAEGSHGFVTIQLEIPEETQKLMAFHFHFKKIVENDEGFYEEVVRARV